MKNHAPRKFLCIDCRSLVARRYEDHKRVGAARMAADIDWRTFAALEIFRDRGAPSNAGGTAA